jgi:glycine cleavage system H protein
MAQLRFTKEHEWIKREGDSAICGISDYAQKSLGDIVYVELPAPGKQVKRGGEVAVVESAKAASEVYAPLDGEITAINDNLATQPGIVNSAPMGDGWFFRLKLADPKQFDQLMDEAAYKEYVAGLTG